MLEEEDRTREGVRQLFYRTHAVEGLACAPTSPPIVFVFVSLAPSSPFPSGKPNLGWNDLKEVWQVMYALPPLCPLCIEGSGKRQGHRGRHQTRPVPFKEFMWATSCSLCAPNTFMRAGHKGKHAKRPFTGIIGALSPRRITPRLQGGGVAVGVGPYDV